MALPKKIGIRSVTGLLYVVVMVGLCFAPDWAALLFLSVVHILLWQEYRHLARQSHKEMYHAPEVYYVFALIVGEAILCWFSRYHIISTDYSLQIVGEWAVIIGILLLPIFIFILFPTSKYNLLLHFIGLIWFSLPLGLMLDIKTRAENVAIFQSGSIGLLAFLVCLWLNDTFAYLIGSLIGRTKLSQASPGKTWEGTIGGAVVTVGVAGYLFYQFSWVAFPHNIILPIIISSFGTVGDLLESMMKRKAKVKDSGNILPGHGGVMDRLDSALIAIIPVHIYLYIIIRWVA